MFPREAIEARLRKAAVGGIVALICLTAWICLIVGCIVLLGSVLGLGGALFVMAGLLGVIALLLVALGRVSATSRSSNASQDSRKVNLLLATVRAVLSGAKDKKKLKIALFLTSAITAGLAVLLSGEDATDED